MEKTLKLVVGIGIGSRTWSEDYEINPNEHIDFAREKGLLAELEKAGGWVNGEGLVGDAWMCVTDADEYLLDRDPAVIAYAELPT